MPYELHILLRTLFLPPASPLLIGMAAFHKEEFGPKEAILVIQSYTKAFEHSPSFPERSLKILAAKGLKSCTTLANLIRN